MEIVNELLTPLSADEFRKNYFCKEPFATPFRAKKLKEFVNFTILNNIILKDHDDCWLVKNGHLFKSKKGQGRLSPAEANRGFLEGHTILLRNCDKASIELRMIKNEFSRSFNLPADIQLYCTPPSQEGLAWHFDHEEVFVIQCHGEKEFFLKKSMDDPKSPEIRCLLKAGDLLFIPSGYWHKARACSLSLHLSIGITAQPQLQSSV